MTPLFTPPSIALVGRANVGKSTLFNYLTRAECALVQDQRQVTRDLHYKKATFNQKDYIVIDTGGLEPALKTDPLAQKVSEKTWEAIREADIIFWITDAKCGYTPADIDLGNQLRHVNKPIYLLINKSDAVAENTQDAHFARAGIPATFTISATQGKGIDALLSQALGTLPAPAHHATTPHKTQAIVFTLVGKPNAGKSTLANCMLQKQRMLVHDFAGTTRESIATHFERKGRSYTLVDTAGIRRKSRIAAQTTEYLSAGKTLQAIHASQIVLLVIDAQAGLSEQDLHILSYIMDSGKSLVIVVNKWDSLDHYQRNRLKDTLDRRIKFAHDAPIAFVSALYNLKVGHLFSAIHHAYDSRVRQYSTAFLTQILKTAVLDHPPPMVAGRRIKLKYAHKGGSSPLLIMIYGNQTEKLGGTYRRYLINCFRTALKLKGYPVKLAFKDSQNPYKDQKNQLTPRQMKRRQRMIRHGRT